MIYYSYYSLDRSGAQLLDILYNYYYCFKNNLTYGGPIKNINGHKNYRTVFHKRAINQTNPLINFLNIPQIEPVDNFEIINNKRCEFSSEFLEMLHNSCKNNLREIKNSTDEFIVCLHVRRGDVQKGGRWGMRYTDDEYYFTLINEIRKYKPDAKIFLFSEKSFEKESNINKYKELGCIFKLGTSLVEAFNFFIQCDIFIMASSTFSIIPALYKKKGLIIYTWSKYFTPLENWISGSTDCFNEYNIEEKKHAIKQYCSV